MRKKKSDPIITERDREILLFIWKYRVSTFQTLRTVFFIQAKPSTAYDRLCCLRSGLYIRSDYLNGTHDLVWMLDKRGFEFLAERILPELTAKTYKPQSGYHDLLVMSALLGEWLLVQPSGVDLISEVQLRTTDVQGIPSALKKDPGHYPDGIWMSTAGKKRTGIGLEVEISGKTVDRYVQTCSFYTSQLFFDHVVWIVMDSGHAKKILDASEKYGIPRDGVHLFIGQRDFEKRIWQSQFLNQSMRHISLSQFLNSKLASSNLYKHPVEYPVQGSTKGLPSLDEALPHSFLNFRIYQRSSDACEAQLPTKSS
jgi:hypothetical protein